MVPRRGAWLRQRRPAGLGSGMTTTSGEQPAIPDAGAAGWSSRWRRRHREKPESSPWTAPRSSSSAPTAGRGPLLCRRKLRPRVQLKELPVGRAAAGRARWRL